MASSLSELQVTLKPKQKEFFDILGNGRDIIVNLPVGYGKSLLYFYIPNFYSRDKENPVVVCIIHCLFSPLQVPVLIQAPVVAFPLVWHCQLDVSPVNYSDSDKLAI